MIGHLLAIFGVGALCAGWVALQHWIASHHPDVRGMGCGSCGTGETCGREGCGTSE